MRGSWRVKLVLIAFGTIFWLPCAFAQVVLLDTVYSENNTVELIFEDSDTSLIAVVYSSERDEEERTVNLIKFDRKGEFIRKTFIGETFHFEVYEISEFENGYQFVGRMFRQNNDYILWVYRTDKELNMLNEQRVVIPDINDDWITRTDLVNDKYYLSGTSDDVTGFPRSPYVIVFDSNFEIIRRSDTTFANTKSLVYGILTNNDNEIFIYGGLGEVFKLDSNLNHELILNESADGDAINIRPFGSILVDKGKLFLSGRYWDEEVSASDPNIGIIKYDENHQKEGVFHMGIDDMDNAAADRAISKNNKGEIYLAGIENSISDYSFKMSTIKLAKLDENLNPIWETSFGGEANYNVNQVIASKDGGCILAGRRYIGEGDIANCLILRYDSTGGISNIWPLDNDEIEMTVFPNPTQDILHIDLSTAGHLSQFRIIDTQGRVLVSYKKNVSTQNQVKMDVSALNTGLYFLQVLSGEQLVSMKAILIE